MSTPISDASRPADTSEFDGALKAANARANSAEQRNAILEAKSQLEDRGLDTLQAELAVFAALITMIVIILSFRVTHQAKAEARNAAREEIKSTRDELATLRSEVKKARDEADRQMEKVSGVVAKVEETEGRARKSLAKIRDHENEASKASEAMRLFTDDEEKRGRPKDRQLSPKVSAALDAAAEEAKDTAQNQWTIDQYRSAIIKAQFSDKDYKRSSELASDMETQFADEPFAVAFARQAIGDAAINKMDWLTALQCLESATKFYSEVQLEDHADAVYARHQYAYVLQKVSRFAEAEKLLRRNLPLCEKLYGPTGENTLAARHNLAACILNQGRATEAENLFAELLPIRQRINGDTSLSTLVTRHEIARAILNQGRADEAEILFSDLIAIETNLDNDDNKEFNTTRHELARAILAQGRAGEAREIFEELYLIKKRENGSGDIGTILTAINLADSLLHSGDLKSARRTINEIPDTSGRIDWSQKYTALLSVVRGKIADGLGEKDDATRLLLEALNIYQNHFPADYYPRRELEEYMENRA